ncbi:hypothetical protein ABZ619_21290 [Streptomyces sp. NPDC007851]|uniref:hypothetical protein n=1 Tax=Streptomyces sp. NPDC007851 TaxID=3155008 RepID=UPI0033E60E89
MLLFLGLLLLAATVAFTALAIAGNLSGGPGYTVSVLDHHIATLGPLAIFCAGLALALICCLALAVMAGGAARRRHPRGGPTTSGRFPGPVV